MTEAEQILYDLFSVTDLGNFIYNIRENESLGWIAPKVILWDDACKRAYKLLKKLPNEKPLPGHTFEFIADTNYEEFIQHLEN